LDGVAVVKRDYREDIDWLRAIAVLAVVAFHFEAPAVYGGFVGVDIFFVISGYLITGIIQSEVASGTFSFARFYERRVRRLLPALYAMVALTAIPSFHYLLTSERADFFRSVAAVITFTSNFFFWFQTGYFDHAAVEKPLLHTWSLAVEEQFYLALPILLWGLLRLFRGHRLVLPVALGALGLASFALSIWLMGSDRSANAFFMSPPRAWEFLIGGLLAVPGFQCCAMRWRKESRAASRWCCSRSRSSRCGRGRDFPASTRSRPASARRCLSGAASVCRRCRAADFRRLMWQDSSGRSPIRCISGIGRCSPSRDSPRAAWCSTPATRSRCSR
jgi:peptidoglycan/LPS O-acetylase OafA/YrhL